MSLFLFLKNIFKKSDKHIKPDRGFFVFENTSEVIRAEKIIKKAGFEVRVMGPPPEIQTGCDLVVEFPLIEELNITRSLIKSGIKPINAVPAKSPLLKPVNIFQIKDFGRHLMVRAANMKLTIDKETNIIVNISGGGCPDVPYLAAKMVGRSFHDCRQPNEFGHTLCAYALQLAYEEMKRQCSA